MLLAVLGGLEALVWAAALKHDLGEWTLWGVVVGASLGALIGFVVGRIGGRVGRCGAAFVMGTLVLPVWLLAALIGVIVMAIRLL